ncbi:MAG: DUF6282 family protein [Euryarchaeota archaeon]
MMEKDLIRLDNYIDTHVHTAPDIKPRICSDRQAATTARNENMAGLVIKCHVESTATRAWIAQKYSNIPVIGGICLNSSVGGINPSAVKICAQLGGKIVWLPTISAGEIPLDSDKLEEILALVRDYDLVLSTGHLGVENIFRVLDLAHSWNLKRILINHPLTGVIGATIDEQKEMSGYGYLEHCFVACMPQHDGLEPQKIARAIQEVGAQKCIMATDFGQTHNDIPVQGFKQFIQAMLNEGITKKQIDTMCRDNPRNLLF